MKKGKIKPQIIKSNKVLGETDEYKKLLILVGTIALIFILFYILTLVFTKKSNDDIFKSDLDASEIQYDEIIVGTMFDQNNDEYYVLLEEKNDPYMELFKTFISTYNSATKKSKIYTLDLNNGFNSKYLNNENSFDKNNFKVKGTTLVKIKNGKIKEHYENKTKIYEKLKKLSEEIAK